MFIQPYSREELHFAYCYRVYLRWRTHKARPRSQLKKLDKSSLSALVSEHDIHILECATDATDLLVEVSLKPTETVSACASKLKGRVSKWLREEVKLEEPADLLSRGYFACTVGRSNRVEVEHYLELQGQHHGYDKRTLPPIFVESYDLGPNDEARISPRHAFVVAQFHVVLATAGRRGIFGSCESSRVAAEWRNLQNELRMALIKVSFVPDHVHIAVRVHPVVSPADLVVALLNAAQDVMAPELVSFGLDRLWQQSAYVGGYGDLVSPQIRKYIENWKRRE